MRRAQPILEERVLFPSCYEAGRTRPSFVFVLAPMALIADARNFYSTFDAQFILLVDHYTCVAQKQTTKHVIVKNASSTKKLVGMFPLRGGNKTLMSHGSHLSSVFF